MTDREAFLTRWSRRKREAAAPRTEAVAEEPATPAAESKESASAPPLPPTRAEPEAELPPIDSIDSGTDIRAFLQEGVPQDLARAALRRAWSSDPAIRDFIGLSENAWDFTAPEGVPGFGPFSPDDARQLVAQVFGETKSASGTEPCVAAVAETDGSASSGSEAEHEVVNAQEDGGTEARPGGGVLPPEGVQPDQDNTAMQQEAAGPGPHPDPSDASG